MSAKIYYEYSVNLHEEEEEERNSDLNTSIRLLCLIDICKYKTRVYSIKC